MSRPGGLWRANPARRSFDSLGGLVVEDVDGDGVSDAARDPNATAGASPVYTRSPIASSVKAGSVGAMPGWGPKLGILLGLGVAVLVARKLKARKAGR